MFNIIMCVILLVLAGCILNKPAMKKFKSFFSAMLGKGADKALEVDPVAVYRDRIEKAAEELRGAVNLLESHSALIKQLKRKIDEDQNEYSLIENRVKKHMEEGTKDKAEEYALSLVKLEEIMQHTKERLESSEKIYKFQTIKIKTLKETVIEYKEKAGKLQSDLQISKAEAEISNLAQKFDSNALGFNDLKEVEDVIQNQIDRNESKASVAQDLYTPDAKSEIVCESRKNKAKELMDKLAAEKK